MRSIERRYNSIAQKNPYWSSFICFASAIQNQGFSRDKIQRHFNQLVDKDDYEQIEKRELLAYLYDLTERDL